MLLARALVQRPGLLLLDEPTNHLDPRYQLELLHQLRRLRLSTLASFHDLNLAAAFCDRLYVLDQGCVVASGTPTDVLTTDLLQQVFGVHALVDRHPSPTTRASPGSAHEAFIDRPAYSPPGAPRPGHRLPAARHQLRPPGGVRARRSGR